MGVGRGAPVVAAQDEAAAGADMAGTCRAACGSLWQVNWTELMGGTGTGVGKKGRQLISPLPALDDLGSSSDPQLQGSVSGGTGQQWGIPRTTPVKPHRDPLSRLGGEAAVCAAPVLLAQNIQDPSLALVKWLPLSLDSRTRRGPFLDGSWAVCAGINANMYGPRV